MKVRSIEVRPEPGREKPTMMPPAPPVTIGFIIPGDIMTPTGGYRYDRMVMEGLGEFGIKVVHVPLSPGYPAPDPATRRATATLIRNIAVDLWLVDGLAFGAFGPVELAAFNRPVIALVHHALCDETGLDPATATALLHSEKQALASATAVIVTSPQTAARVCDLFGLKTTRVHVAVPGVIGPVLPDEQRSHKLRLLCVGSVSPRKGYDLLVQALAPLKGQAWHLNIAGRLDDADTTRDLRQQIEQAGLAQSVTLCGALGDEELASLWTSHDALLFPSRYEGYGMVLTEALAHGLAVLCSDQVPAAEGLPAPAVMRLGVLDRQGWTSQIAAWLETPERVRTAKQAARDIARTLPQWRDTAAQIADIIQGITR
jgi:glycosyltransferase involved in cell wall biosynthesis